MVSSRLFLRMPVSPAGDSPPLTPRHERLRHNIKVVPDGSVSCSHPCGAQVRATQNFCSIFCTLHKNLKHILVLVCCLQTWICTQTLHWRMRLLFLSATNCPSVVDLPPRPPPPPPFRSSTKQRIHQHCSQHAHHQISNAGR